MQNGIQIDLKRTGFPVKIGTVELWFDNSYENLDKLLKVEELEKEKTKALNNRAKNLQLPTIENGVNDKTIKALGDAAEIKKELIMNQYDVLFGDGAFQNLYEVYPDIIALDDALTHVCSKIEQTIDKQSSKLARTKKPNKKSKK